MSNKQRYTNEYIMSKAIEYVEKYGFDKINARSLAKYMNISTQPLFKNYENLNDLKKELYIKIKKQYLDNVNSNINVDDYLFTLFYSIIDYAKQNPNLFKTIFYSDFSGSRTINEIINSEQNQDAIKKISYKYNLSKKKSEEIYRDLRFYTLGIANHLAEGTAIIENDELKEILKNLINKLLN